MIERFESNPQNTVRENLLTSLLMAGGMFAILYFVRDERNLAVLMGFTLGGAVITFLFYQWLAQRTGRQTIEISPEGIRISNRKGARYLAWADVRRVDHTLYGGDQWRITPHQGQTFHLRVEGLSYEEASKLGKLIREYATFSEAGKND